MLEQLTQSFQKTNAKRITSLRERREFLRQEVAELNQRIERINLEIIDLITVAEDTAEVQAERMTVQQADLILQAVAAQSHVDDAWRREIAEQLPMEDAERWDGLS